MSVVVVSLNWDWNLHFVDNWNLNGNLNRVRLRNLVVNWDFDLHRVGLRNMDFVWDWNLDWDFDMDWLLNDLFLVYRIWPVNWNVLKHNLLLDNGVRDWTVDVLVDNLLNWHWNVLHDFHGVGLWHMLDDLLHQRHVLNNRDLVVVHPMVVMVGSDSMMSMTEASPVTETAMAV